MNKLSKAQIASRQKTLLAALLLSMWAPIVTGIAVLLSRSATQLADFIRRRVEFIALLISWQVFRYIEAGQDVSQEKKARLRKAAGFSVAVALSISGISIFGVTIIRIIDFQPGGNVYPGLAIAVLAIIVNSWFWIRYSRMTREHYNKVIDFQRLMYRAKTIVDLSVIIALSFIAIGPGLEATRYIDALGSVVVSFYLVWSGITTLRTTLKKIPAI